MERRNFLKLTGASFVAAGTGIGLTTCGTAKYLGWVPNVQVTHQFRRRNPRINFKFVSNQSSALHAIKILFTGSVRGDP